MKTVKSVKIVETPKSIIFENALLNSAMTVHVQNIQNVQ